MSETDQKAWGEFWQARSARKGCLPEALLEIDAVQQQCWEEFARGLPRRARVLDLATGNGIVLSKLLRVRPDLKAVGVDSSPVLSTAPAGTKLMPGIAMEKLPFGPASFQAVTSQFGVEYGDTAAVAAEIGRVLRPGGRTRFIMHHSSGPILAHNLARREALHWAAHTSGYLDRALAFARARALGPLPTPPSFRAAVTEARQKFPAGSVAEEFVTAILQTLDLGRRWPLRDALEVLGKLRREANNEMARIDSLERAACDEDKIELVQRQLRANRLAGGGEPRLLFETSKRGSPFGWLLDARRE